MRRPRSGVVGAAVSEPVPAFRLGDDGDDGDLVHLDSTFQRVARYAHRT